MTITIVPAPLRVSCLLLLSAAACEQAPDVGNDSLTACVVETDGSQESNPDGVAERTSIRRFNAEGKTARIDTDTNGDGGMDEYTVFFYDDEGNAIGAERRGLAQDELRSSRQQTFDSEGRMILTREDSDGDGFIERVEVVVYHQMGHRRVATTFRPSDERVELIEESHYGPFGIERHARSSPSNELNSEVETLYTYERGLLTRVEYYRDAELISTTENRYTERGQKLSSLDSRDGATSLLTYSHDERGFINGWVRDDELDGTIDGSAVCGANADGIMISEHMDNDNDGTVDYIFLQSFDELGRLTQDVLDTDGDLSNARKVVSYRYDCDDLDQ